MAGSDDELAAVLVREGDLTVEHLQLALEWKSQARRSLVDVLLEMRAVPEDVLRKRISALGIAPRVRATDPIPQPPRGESVRRFTRSPTTLEVGLPTWGDARRAYTQNLSRGGLGFRAHDLASAPRLGQEVTLALVMPDGQRFELAAVVRYVEAVDGAHSIGVQFTGLRLEALLAIDAVLRQHADAGEQIRWLD